MSWECVYSSMSHVRAELHLPMADIYYSEPAVYSVGLGSAGTWLLLLSGGDVPPPHPTQSLLHTRPLLLYCYFIYLQRVWEITSTFTALFGH